MVPILDVVLGGLVLLGLAAIAVVLRSGSLSDELTHERPTLDVENHIGDPELRP